MERIVHLEYVMKINDLKDRIYCIFVILLCYFGSNIINHCFFFCLKREKCIVCKRILIPTILKIDNGKNLVLTA